MQDNGGLLWFMAASCRLHVLPRYGSAVLVDRPMNRAQTIEVIAGASDARIHFWVNRSYSAKAIRSCSSRKTKQIMSDFFQGK